MSDSSDESTVEGATRDIAEVPAVEVPPLPPLSVDIRDGYQPAWLEGTSLACGAYVSDIPGGWGWDGFDVNRVEIPPGWKDAGRATRGCTTRAGRHKSSSQGAHDMVDLVTGLPQGGVKGVVNEA